MSAYSHLFAKLDADIERIYARARGTDPDTSQIAADRADKFAANHGARILAALQDYGPMTAEEIGKHIGLSVVQVDRRIHELVKACVVVATGSRKPSSSGCPMRVWMAVKPPMARAA